MDNIQNIITDFIVHKLIKEAHSRDTTIELRPAPLTINKSVQRLVDELYKIYAGRVSKGYGKFETDENNYPFPKFIREHFSDNSYNFFQLSSNLMSHLKSRSETELLATGGFVLIAKVQSNGSEFLLVAIVTEILGSAITSGLDVVDSSHLDMSQLRVAGRIDITSWQQGHPRYISFIKGRGDIATYFKLFLGCNDVMIAAQESKKLVDALNDFAFEQNLSPEARDKLFESSYNFLKDLSKNGNPVSLEALANHVYSDDPEKLKVKLSDSSIALSDEFIPDGRSIKSLTKFNGKSDFWQVTFDRKAIRNGSVRYDISSDTIILSNIPADLRKELIEESNE